MALPSVLPRTEHNRSRRNAEDPVVDLLHALDKAVRAARLYAGRGAVVEHAVEALSLVVCSVTTDAPLVLVLSPDSVTWRGNADGVPIPPHLFRLYGDGVRELTFMRRPPRDELAALVEVLATDPRQEEVPAVTLLWERDLDGVRHYAVDTLALGCDDSGDDEGSGEVGDLRLGRGGEGTAQLALSADQARALRVDDRRPWALDASAPDKPPVHLQDAAFAAREAFSRPRCWSDFLAIAAEVGEGERVSPMVVDLFDAMVRTEDARGVAALLGALGRFPREREVLLDAARCAGLAPLFLKHTDLLVEPLERMLREGGRPEGLVHLLEALPSGPAARSLQQLLDDGGLDLTAVYAAQLREDEPERMAEAIEALGRVGSASALQALAGCLGSRLTRTRRAVLEAMAGRYHPDNRRALARALRDPDKDNRLLVLGILGASEDPLVARSLVVTIEGPRFSELDLDEQVAWFQALAALGGPLALTCFRRMLDRASFLAGRREQQRLALAATALAAVPGAERLLAELSGRWYHGGIVKQALRAATAGGDA